MFEATPRDEHDDWVDAMHLGKCPKCREPSFRNIIRGFRSKVATCRYCGSKFSIDLRIFHPIKVEFLGR